MQSHGLFGTLSFSDGFLWWGRVFDWLSTLHCSLNLGGSLCIWGSPVCGFRKTEPLFTRWGSVLLVLIMLFFFQVCKRQTWICILVWGLKIFNYLVRKDDYDIPLPPACQLGLNKKNDISYLKVKRLTLYSWNCDSADTLKKITRHTTTSERNKFLQVVASFR